MIKVAMLFQEAETSGMDLSHPEQGNPGVGGTAFCFLLLSRFMEERDEVEITTYQLQDNHLPGTRNVKVQDLREALELAKQQNIELMLVRNHQTSEDYALLEAYDFKYIFWMHNKLTYEEIVRFRTWQQVKRIICVGREMYDYYLDDPISEKLECISNMFVPPGEAYIRQGEYAPIVTYMGSLTYDKNFHLLTEVWKQVREAVPEAQLHVIGSGKLYDKNSILGSYGYAEKEYEDLFMPGITDETGSLLPGVVFHGILGDEKYEVFRSSAVGVVNPMATETFCLAAIEMEACGIPVLTRRKNGLLDTVQAGKTGILYKKISALAPSLIGLLQNKAQNEAMGKQAAIFARNDFLPEHIIPKWIAVFAAVAEGRPAKYARPTANFDNNGKWLRFIMHGLRRIPFLKHLPSIHDIQKK